MNDKRITVRFTYDELSKLELIQEMTDASNLSDAVRYCVDHFPDAEINSYQLSEVYLLVKDIHKYVLKNRHEDACFPDEYQVKDTDDFDD